MLLWSEHGVLCLFPPSVHIPNRYLETAKTVQRSGSRPPRPQFCSTYGANDLVYREEDTPTVQCKQERLRKRRLPTSTHEAFTVGRNGRWWSYMWLFLVLVSQHRMKRPDALQCKQRLHASAKQSSSISAGYNQSRFSDTP